jgi:hypothetical protein
MVTPWLKTTGETMGRGGNPVKDECPNHEPVTLFTLWKGRGNAWNDEPVTLWERVGLKP